MSSAANAPPIDGSAAWDELRRQLPGTWEAIGEAGPPLEATYRSMSRGSALVETFGSAPEKQTLSVYHRDASSLMMTHYCGQGNQARLRVAEASTGRVVFRALDATNVSADQSVLHELVFELSANALVRTERYRAHDGSIETTVIRFRRRSPD